jgi:hypothetical protein
MQIFGLTSEAVHFDGQLFLALGLLPKETFLVERLKAGQMQDVVDAKKVTI